MASPTVLARRSLCYLLCDQPDRALRDAMQAQCTLADWPTAFYLQSVALTKLDMHNDSADMLNEAATLEEKRQKSYPKTSWLTKLEPSQSTLFSSHAVVPEFDVNILWVSWEISSVLMFVSVCDKNYLYICVLSTIYALLTVNSRYSFFVRECQAVILLWALHQIPQNGFSIRQLNF